MESWRRRTKRLLEYLNFWEDDFNFTVELEDDEKLSFLNVLLLKIEYSLDFKIYRKPTNNNRFLFLFSPVKLAKEKLV